LIIGMSPSVTDGYRRRAFHPGARTTKNIATAVGCEPCALDEHFDLVNLDSFRAKEGPEGRAPYIDPKEARKTLEALHQGDQLAGRVIVLLGRSVCSAFAEYFATSIPKPPCVELYEHPDGWNCWL